MCSSIWRSQNASDAAASIRARASHSSRPGGVVPHASQRSRITVAISPTTPTSAARLPPMRSGAMSTWSTVWSTPKSGAPPYMTLALKADPSTSTQSALGRARPPWTSDPRLQGSESATTPRAALAVITGIPAISAKRAISAPASDQNAPLPATITGRSAEARAATSAPISAGAAHGRGNDAGDPGATTSNGATRA